MIGPVDGITAALAALAFFLLGFGLGERRALATLLRVLEREGIDPRDLPAELLGRVRHRLPSSGA